MLGEKEIRELSMFAANSPVLSIYLDTEPSLGNAETYRLRLRSMMKDVDLPDDINAVENYFHNTYNWSGRGVAIFSCAAEGLFHAFPLAIPVPDLVHVGDRPSVKPLADLFDTYGQYGVVLVDQQGARLFSFNMGELVEHEGVMGEIVKRKKLGGASSFPGRRGGVVGRTQAAREVVDRNIKGTVEFATSFFEEHHTRRILIGGTEDTVAQFRALLPKAWQSLVMGVFSLPMTASTAEVRHKAAQIGLQAEEAREERLVNNLITQASKRMGAVIGLGETLKAVDEGRVETLVITRAFHVPGYRCPDCQRLGVSDKLDCTGCKRPAEALPDVVEAAINTVLKTGGDIEVIQKENPLEKHGGIGAFVRY